MKKTENIDNEVLAERVKTLFTFCAMLVPYKDKLKAVMEEAANRSSFALDAAPIITAFGGDYEAKHFDAELHRKRAEALYNLITTLEDTENERGEFTKEQKAKEKGRKQLAKILGDF